MKREHSVRCHNCPIMVTDLTKTKTQIRADLRKQGWAVAIPFWVTLSPRPNRFERAAMKGKTVDRCKSCQRHAMTEVMRGLTEQYLHNEQAADRIVDKKLIDMDKKLIDMPCPPTVQ